MFTLFTGRHVGGPQNRFAHYSVARKIPKSTWIEKRNSVCHNAILEVEIRRLEWFRYIDLYSFAGCRPINLFENRLIN